MRSPPANLRAKAEHVCAVHLRRVAGRQIVREHHMRRSQPRKTRVIFPEQIVNHTPRHVENIHRALTQIRVVHFRQRLRVALRDGIKCVLRVALLRAEKLLHFIHQNAVLDHEQMRIKNRRIMRAELFGHALLHRHDLPASGCERCL